MDAQKWRINSRFILSGLMMIGLVLLGTYCTDNYTATEQLSGNCSGRYDDFEGPIPSKDQYDGPLYTLGQNWPQELPPIPEDAPWLQYENINDNNMVQFMDDMKTWVFNQMIPADFRMDQVDWYAIPFQPREAIRGMYDGNNQPAFSYDKQQSEEAINFTTEFYNNRGGYTIGQVFGNCDSTIYQPVVNRENVLFPEGTVVIKLAMTALPDTQAPILAGAFSWDVYVDSSATVAPTSGGDSFNPMVTKVKLIQMDIIVKDKRLAPETGWVFGTLAYDKIAEATGYNGDDENLRGLYKMVPLGAMIGMDPGVIVSEINGADTALHQTFINPSAPAYTVPLLGWGGRLSGPIDGAQGFSSCMGCHVTAQWNTANLEANKTIFEDTRIVKGDTINAPIFIPFPMTDSTKLTYTKNLLGSQAWCDTADPFYQDVMGCRDPGSDWIGMDYDFVMFKGILHASLDGKGMARPVFEAAH